MIEHHAQNSNNLMVSDHMSSIKVQNRNKRKSNNMEGPSASKLINNNNYYAALDLDSDECVLNFKEYVTQKQSKTGDKQISSNNKAPLIEKRSVNGKCIEADKPLESTKSDNKAKNKVPPIIIYNIEPDKLIEVLTKGIKIKNFKIKENREQKQTLYLQDLNTFILVKDFLTKTKVQFFTYSPKSLKNKTYLLKGLNANTDPKLILKELEEHQNDHLKFIKVTQFATKNSKKNETVLPIFMVQITPDSSINALKTIKTILYRCVNWEPLKKEGIAQCRNCQGFFHSAANCYLPPKCVKCDQPHNSKDCKTDESRDNDQSKVYCVLCKKYGHPASYKGCEKYTNLKLKLIERKKNISRKHINNPNFINPNIKFADLSKSTPTQNISNNEYISNNEKLTNNLLLELKKAMDNLREQLLNLQKQQQEQASRIDILFSLLEVQHD